MTLLPRAKTAGLAASAALLATTFAAQAQQQQPQQVTVQGLVIGRNGPTLSIKTPDTPRLTVLLSDTTEATQKGGFLGLDRKHPGITELVPGLFVKVQGAYDPDHKLVAKKIVFSHSSMKTAQQINAGLNPVAEEVAAAQDQLRSDRRDIDANGQTLEQHGQDIDANKQAIAANGLATTGNTQAIGRTNGRFGQLDQYETRGSLTVNFANGKAIVSPRDRSELTSFVRSAANTPGFMIEVEGYASAVGNPTLNQRLSSERADAVLSIIQQSGAVPLTRILAPAAMGTTNQLANNRTRRGQAENRRVVVTILINKGITGNTPATPSGE